MSGPLERITPPLPANWVRRPDDKRRRPEKPRPPPRDDGSHPPESPGDRPKHIIDELA